MNYNYSNNNNLGQRYKVYSNSRRQGSNFLFPFALGFVSSPLIFGATRPRPIYPGPMVPPPGSYFPYY